MKNATIFAIIVVLATLMAFSWSVAFAGNENANAKNDTTNVTENMTNVTTNITNVTGNLPNATNTFAETKGVVVVKRQPRIAINNTTNATYPTNETKLAAITKR